MRAPKKNYKHSHSASRPFLKKAVKWLFVAGLWAGLALVIVLAWYAKELPGIIENPKIERKASITVLANDGSVIGRYGDQKGESLSVDRLPKSLINAILATEDRRFYYHFGIDPIGLTRAIVINAIKGGTVQGGSTITQQLAKNLFLTHEKTYKRKIQEALLAIWLEHELTKDEILSAYLNRVYMGSGAYGVDAASHIYFKKSARDLTVHESALIAGLLKAPSRYSPTANPKAAHERAKVVLAAMVDEGYLSEEEAQKASKKNSKLKDENDVGGESSRYFADWVVDSLEDIIGVPTEDITVKTTLDPEVQEYTALALKESIEKNGAKMKATQAAAVVLRPDGSIVAMAGGIDYRKSQFNRAVQGLRQPGSSFKPFVYLAALEAGMNEYSMVNDAPFSIGSYRPQNFGNKYYGEVTLTDALTMSMNTVAVQLAYQVGVEHVISVARRAGITAELVPNLSLALGSSGVSMVEMAQGYAVLASGGHAVKAFNIVEIRSKNGKKLYEHKSEPAPRVFRGHDVNALTNMMRSVVQYGTGQAAQGPYSLAGKTGTSQDHRDAWFDGFTDQYIASIWFGNDNNSSMSASITGGGLPARAFKQIMTAAVNDPTPSKYHLEKSYDISDEFNNMMQNILSQPGDEFNNGASGSPTDLNTPYQPPRFDNMREDGQDNVGYQRMNN